MDLLKLDYSDNPSGYLKTLLELQEDGVALEIGTALLPKGTRLPEHGKSSFPRHEVSIVLEGEIRISSAEQSTILKSGDIVSIPAGEYSNTITIEDTRLIYLFFGKNEPL